MGKNTVIIILSAIIIIAGSILIGKRIIPKSDPGIINLEEIRKIREFHVVSFKYEDLFFYHNKQDQGKRVVAIASVPVSLRAYFDMTKAEIEQTDSVLVLKLPPALFTDPSYAFDEMQTRTVRRFSVIAGVDIHKKMLNSLRNKVRERKPLIIEHANSAGIREMAAQQAKEYFQRFFESLGYNSVQVMILRPGVNENSLESGEDENLIGIDGILVLED